MSQTINIAPHAADVLVFALSMSAPEAEALHDPSALAARLGASLQRSDGAEIVALSDIAAMGLPAYLSEGYDLDVASHAPRLAALDGHALILRTTAFAGVATVLKPDRDFTLIARMPERRGAPASLDALHSDSAQGTLASGNSEPYNGDHHASRRTLLLGVLAALALLVVVTLAIRWAS